MFSFKRGVLGAAAVAMALAIAPVQAQDKTKFDKTVEKIMAATKPLLLTAKKNDGTPIYAPAEKDKDKPVMPAKDAARAVKAGRLSALAEWCVPDIRDKVRARLMKTEHFKNKWSDAQMVYFDLLHRATYGLLLPKYKKRGACPADTIKDVRLKILGPKGN